MKSVDRNTLMFMTLQFINNFVVWTALWAMCVCAAPVPAASAGCSSNGKVVACNATTLKSQLRHNFPASRCDRINVIHMKHWKNRNAQAADIPMPLWTLAIKLILFYFACLFAMAIFWKLINFIERGRNHCHSEVLLWTKRKAFNWNLFDALTSKPSVGMLWSIERYAAITAARHT